jgi:glyoxylase I family protein
MITGFHHIAIIVSQAERSVAFYEQVLGFSVVRKTYREERNSWKIDMVYKDMQLELFTFPNAPERPTNPEAMGLRHLAFQVEHLALLRNRILAMGWPAEPVRDDILTGKRFFFISDPDGLPLEFYET